VWYLCKGIVRHYIYLQGITVNTELLIPLLTFGGTLLLVVTGLLNFSVFLRQLRAAREQLETARRQLESAREQPQIQLVQRAIAETI
jgi:type II secretory pathway pseudopilin PulG